MSKTTKHALKSLKIQPVVDTHKLRSRRHAKRVTVWLIIILLTFNIFTGVLTYGAMTIRCMRLPVTASSFASGYHYFKPGQSGYGPNLFAQYYCTEDDARNAGFNPARTR